MLKRLGSEKTDAGIPSMPNSIMQILRIMFLLLMLDGNYSMVEVADLCSFTPYIELLFSHC